MIAGAVAGFAIGVAAGLGVGRALGLRSSWAFWLANAGAFAIGVAVAVYGLWLDASWVYLGGVGIVGGGMTGLKYGSGRVRLLVSGPADTGDGERADQ
jgi:hypothetical protein